MQKPLKITLAFLGIIILVAITAIAYLVTFVNPNDFKAQISAKVQQNTGRTLVINGDLKWSFFPWLGIEVNNATLSNAPGFGDQPFAKIIQAEVKVKLMPLLSGTVEIGNVTLNGLEVNLMQNSQGITNWQDLIKQNTANSATPDTEKTSTNKSHELNFDIAGINVKNSKISWLNQQNNQHIVLSDLQINTGNLKLDQTVPFSINFSLQSNQPKLNGTFAFNSDVTGNPAAKTYQFANSTLKLVLNDSAYKDGQLTINLQSNIQVNLADETLQINDLKANLDDSQLTGNFALTDFSQKAVTFDLKIDRLNADRYLTKNNSTQTATKSTNTAAAKNSPLLPIDTLRTLNLQGTMQIGSLHLDNLDTTDINLQIKANNGLINLNPITTTIYQGKYQGDILLNAKENTPQITADNQLTNIQIQPLLLALSHITRLQMTGTGNVTSHITTQGNTTAEIISHMNGQGKVALNNGVIKGIDIVYWVKFGKALLNKEAPSTTNTKQTDFGNLTATYNINNGVVSNNDLYIHAPTYEAKGQGTANLITQVLDYKLSAQLLTVDSQKPQGAPIPLVISGPFANVSIKPDVSALLKNGLQDKINNELEKRLGPGVGKNVGKQINSFLQQLTQ